MVQWWFLQPFIAWMKNFINSLSLCGWKEGIWILMRDGWFMSTNQIKHSGWCSGDHPERNVAKFGYIPELKVFKKIKSFLYSFLALYLPTYWNLSLKSGDLKILKNLQNLVNLGHFFSSMKNPMYRETMWHLTCPQIWPE